MPARSRNLLGPLSIDGGLCRQVLELLYRHLHIETDSLGILPNDRPPVDAGRETVHIPTFERAELVDADLGRACDVLQAPFLLLTTAQQVFGEFRPGDKAGTAAVLVRSEPTTRCDAEHRCGFVTHGA